MWMEPPAPRQALAPQLRVGEARERDCSGRHGQDVLGFGYLWRDVFARQIPAVEYELISQFSEISSKSGVVRFIFKAPFIGQHSTFQLLNCKTFCPSKRAAVMVRVPLRRARRGQ